ADWIADFNGLGGTSAIYSEFDNLTAGLIQYISDNIDLYDKIYVSGHSLGGAMTQYFLNNIAERASGDLADTLAGKLEGKLEGLTFGSVGTSVVTNREDAAPFLMNIMHTGDIAQSAPAGVRVGTTIFINTSQPTAPIIGEHFKEPYFQDTQI